jgi:type I restriction enzyme S subunit
LELLIQTNYFYEQIMLFVTGTAQYNVSSGQVQSCIVALPPINQQRQLTAFAKEQLAKFDTLITKATQAITLLRERRAALISAAVTGKIDVRALATSQPEAA